MTVEQALSVIPAPAPPVRGLPAGTLIGPAVWALAHARVAQWKARALDPEPSQRATLRALCAAAARTEFGVAHDLGRARTYEDFAARVPLRPYADFEPQLVRMRRGERDVLWPGCVPWFARSSGTSNTASIRKLLPISREQVGWQRRLAFDVTAQYLVQSGDRSLTRGFGIALTPSTAFTREGAVELCTNPALMLALTPEPARRFALPEGRIAEMADVDVKLSAIAASYLDQDVRLISGNTCWFPVLFDRVIEAARARHRCVTTIADVWPKLGGLIGGGMSPAPYREWIAQRVGRSVTLVNHYNATEGGVFACADRAGDETMLVIPDRGVFMEFVPSDELARPDATRVPLWRVEPGVTYAIVVTTSSGLFGYVVGDLVRFTETFPHRLDVVGRSAGGLSITQEQTSDAELEAAIVIASHATGRRVREFCAAGEIGVGSARRGRYVFLVEFDGDAIDVVAFAREVDASLCAQNYVYALSRAGDVGLVAPEVVALPNGTATRVLRAFGIRSPQQKVPRVVDGAVLRAMREASAPPLPRAGSTSPLRAPSGGTGERKERRTPTVAKS